MFLTGRKVGEEIFLGEDIRIVINQVDGGTVKIGIEAPPHVKTAIPAIEKKKKKPETFTYEF